MGNARLDNQPKDPDFQERLKTQGKGKFLGFPRTNMKFLFYFNDFWLFLATPFNHLGYFPRELFHLIIFTTIAARGVFEPEGIEGPPL